MAVHASPSRHSSFPLSASRGTRQLPVPSPICTNFLPSLSASSCYRLRQQSLSTESLYTHSQQYMVSEGDSYYSPTHLNSSSSSASSSSPSSPPSSMPSSVASSPSPTSPLSRQQSPLHSRHNIRGGNVTKRSSISSLLSSSDDSSGKDSSSRVSSPSFNWSGNNSPTITTTTTACTSRSSSVGNSPVNGLHHPTTTTAGSGPCFSPVEYNMPRAASGSAYGGSGEQNEKPSMYTVAPLTRKKARSSRNANITATNRDEYDVLGRKKPKTPRTPMSWDPKDDILLKQLKEEQRLGWKEIATHFHGRTSHACQFRWRRLASGQLKYYQGHRRPPPVTTTSASFANEMASTAAVASISCSPKILMNGMQSMSPTATSPRTLHVIPQMPHTTTEPALPPMQHVIYQSSMQPNWGQSASLYQPTPLPSPNSYAPRFLGEEYGRDRCNWSEQEDSLLLNRKLSFDEVNVLLTGRSEHQIWERMVKLRQNEMGQRHQSMQCMDDVRRESFEQRIPGISVGVLGYHSPR